MKPEPLLPTVTKALQLPVEAATPNKEVAPAIGTLVHPLTLPPVEASNAVGVI